MIAQLLLDKTGLTPARILVAYVVAGVFLGAVGVYAPLVEWAGAGATVPLTGFGYNIAKGVREAVDERGWIGALSGPLTAASAGTAAALVCGFIAALIFKAKPKKEGPCIPSDGQPSKARLQKTSAGRKKEGTRATESKRRSQKARQSNSAKNETKPQRKASSFAVSFFLFFIYTPSAAFGESDFGTPSRRRQCLSAGVAKPAVCRHGFPAKGANPHKRPTALLAKTAVRRIFRSAIGATHRFGRSALLTALLYGGGNVLYHRRNVPSGFPNDRHALVFLIAKYFTAIAQHQSGDPGGKQRKTEHGQKKQRRHTAGRVKRTEKVDQSDSTQHSPHAQENDSEGFQAFFPFFMLLLFRRCVLWGLVVLPAQIVSIFFHSVFSLSCVFAYSYLIFPSRSRFPLQEARGHLSF